MLIISLFTIYFRLVAKVVDNKSMLILIDILTTSNQKIAIPLDQVQRVP